MWLDRHHKMLCIDIETTGLDPRIHDVTVACTFDGNEAQVYHFKKPNYPTIIDKDGNTQQTCQTIDACSVATSPQCDACRQWHFQNVCKLFEALDKADYIGGFNIIHFDLPFLRKSFKLTDKARYKSWLEKSLDPFYVAKKELGKWPSLQSTLMANGLPGKSGDGKCAIEYVQRGKWDELQRYCMDDTVLCYKLLSLKEIRLPPLGFDAYLCMKECDQKKRFKLVVRYRNAGRMGFKT